MTERDWQADWELAMRATPGSWKALKGRTFVHLKLGERRIIEAPYTDMAQDDIDFSFIAESREALPYWLNQMLDVVMSLCHEGVMTMSRAREILGVTLHEADKLYTEWLKTYGTAGGKQILKQDTVTGRTVRVDMSYSDIIDK